MNINLNSKAPTTIHLVSLRAKYLALIMTSIFSFVLFASFSVGAVTLLAFKDAPVIFYFFAVIGLSSGFYMVYGQSKKVILLVIAIYAITFIALQYVTFSFFYAGDTFISILLAFGMVLGVAIKAEQYCSGRIYGLSPSYNDFDYNDLKPFSNSLYGTSLSSYSRKLSNDEYYYLKNLRYQIGM